MKIVVRHSDAACEGRLKPHAEKLLRRVLDGYSQSIDLVEVKLTIAAGAERWRDYRCILKVKLLPDGSVQAQGSDREDILAVYRAADRVKIFLEQRLK